MKQIDLTHSTFADDKFVKVELSGDTFEEKEFEDCAFVGCNFTQLKLKHCRLINCRFESCRLDMKLTDSSVSGCSFTECSIQGTDWTLARQLQDLSFFRCRLNFANFRQLKLEGVRMSDCELVEADFTETDLSKGDLSGSDLKNAIFHKTNLTSADLRRAKNYFLDVRTNSIRNIRLSIPEALTLLTNLQIKLE